MMFRRPANPAWLVALACFIPAAVWAEVPALQNFSFELPARAEGQEAARPSIEAWQFSQAGVAVNDGSWSSTAEGAEGEQFAFLQAASGSRLFQDLPGGLAANSEHIFRIKVGFRTDAQPASGASVALRLQTIDDSGRATANLAITTVIAGRENLSDALAPFEVSFTTGDIAPPGRLRVMVDTVQASSQAETFWILDDAALQVLAVPAKPKAILATPIAPGELTYTYSRDISPILTENCFACHGPDAAAREARLRLDVREDATAPNRRGRIAIVPGDAEASTAFQRMLSTDEDEIMPPPESHKILSKDQIEMLRVWINEGAVYQEHWAYQPIVRPALPEVTRGEWPRQPLDAFVLEKLEENQLAPAPEADPRTLARRVALDLTGLPPAPELLEEFLADASPGAYERLVDRLLASPAWGEHRGRYWLDVARYADTHGIHFDNYREIWGYRDWVINAFNRNLPFDQFTIEQLSGDLLPKPSEEQLIATGFNRCNITTSEGGVIEEEYRVLYSIDRTDAMATTWLGMTASCAACHDHKFDPLPAADFYSLAAFFNNSTTPIMDGNAKNPAPTVMLLEGEDRIRWDQLNMETPAAEAALSEFIASARERFEARMLEDESVLLGSPPPSAGLVYQTELSGLGASGSITVTAAGEAREIPAAPSPAIIDGPAGSPALRLAEPGLALPGVPALTADQAFSVGLWVNLENINQTGSLLARLDDSAGFRGFDLWFQGGFIGTHLVHSWADDAIKVVSEGRIEGKRWHHVMLTYDGSSKAAGVRLFIDGVEQRVRIEADNLRSPIDTDVPFRLARREHRDEIQGLAVSSLHYFDRAIGRDEVSALAMEALLREILAKPAEQRDDAERQRLFDAYLVRSEGEAHGAAVELVARLKAEGEAMRARTPITHIFKEAETLPISYVLNRGEYDQRLDLVPAKTPDALPPMAGDLPRNRLGLAKWLLSDEQPLTARVTVNRFWLELFGNGIVTTPGDFGLSGQMPSHPELLDWLAIEFRENGWDIKAFYRMLVTSATYRQAAVFDEERLEKDPLNILLSRGPRFRMDAEMIRDQALVTSGLLVPKIGGPSVKPYQPDGVWEAVAMRESNTRDYRRDSGESLYRRSLYTFWKRSAPPASMEVFNAPNREVCTVQRERGNTPIQALAALNDPQLIEAARHLSQLAFAANPGADADGARLDFMTLRLLARPLHEPEVAVLTDSLAEMRGYYREHAEDAAALISVGESPVEASIPPSELAAWTIIANQLLNLDEALTK